MSTDDSDTDGFRPELLSTSSLLLITYLLASMLCALFVSASIARSLTHSASAKLVFYLNIAHTCAIFAKIPFLFFNIPHGCTIAGAMSYYFTTQIYLIVAGMLQCTNHLKMDLPTSTSVYSSKSFGLNKMFEVFLFLCPLGILVLPLSKSINHHDNVFSKRFNWCGTDVSMDDGKWVIIQMIVFVAIVFGYILYSVVVIMKRIQSYSSIIPPHKIRSRIMKGPLLYGLVTILTSIFILIAVYVTSNDDSNTKSAYYFHYFIVILMATPGFVYFGIFWKEKRHFLVS
jgi:hypothetical protein